MARKTWWKKAISGVFLAVFAVCASAAAVAVFGATPVEALQGVATQEINIHVKDEIVELDPEESDAPATGVGGASGVDGAVPMMAVGAAVVAAVGIAAVVVRRTRGQRARAGKAGRKASIIAPVLALGALATLLAVRPASAAIADPTIELSNATMTYNLRAGESAALKFDATVVKDVGSTDYVLSVMPDNTNADIAFNIDGNRMGHASGDEADVDAVLEIVEPMVFYSSNSGDASVSGAGEISSHDLSVSVGESVAPGDYKVMMTYFVNTDDGEWFNFTIDTRMTDTLDNNAAHLDGTATAFAIPTSGYVGRDESHDYSWVIDWGDGTPAEIASGTSDDTSAGILHDYATPGEYHIMIKTNGPAVSGWMNAFGFTNTSLGANAQTNKNMLKSIDSPLTDAMRTGNTTYRFAYMFHGARNAEAIPEWLFSGVNVTYSESTNNMFNSTFANFAANSTSASIPSGLFESLDTTNATNASNLFRDTFFGHAAASTSGTIPADLFSSIHLADGVNAADMFGGTFYLYANNSLTGTIPSGLFATVDTTNAANITGMFSGTFANYARASAVGTIPADLFATIRTGNATDTAYLFNGTFSSFAQASGTTIPAGLFDAVDTSRAVNLSSMFAGTFSSFANNSTTATIPAGLFGGISTAGANNASNLFRDTFSNYAGLSAVATIPSGLFDAVNTAKITHLPGMFSGTFYFYGHVSPTAAIPAGLFTQLDLSGATNVHEVFYKTFDSFAYEATTPTDINAIWGNANFAGRVTADNASAFFNSTFSNVTRLTGTAQTFIDGKLGGITPASAAHTFATTAVSDMATLDVNWK